MFPFFSIFNMICKGAEMSRLLRNTAGNTWALPSIPVQADWELFCAVERTARVSIFVLLQAHADLLERSVPIVAVCLLSYLPLNRYILYVRLESYSLLPVRYIFLNTFSELSQHAGQVTYKSSVCDQSQCHEPMFGLEYSQGVMISRTFYMLAQNAF